MLHLAGKLDNNMIYVDDAMHTTTITGLVNRTFESFTVSVQGNMECIKDEMFVDLFEKASASVKRSKTHKLNSSKTTEEKNNDTKEVSHHNDSKRSVVIDGKPFK